MIPSGDIIQKARQQEPFRVLEGGISLCRDGFHMSIPYGRYLLACVWMKTLLPFGHRRIPMCLRPEKGRKRQMRFLLKRIRQIVTGKWNKAGNML